MSDGSPHTPPSSRAAFAVLDRIERGFKDTQQRLREQVVSVSSCDGRLRMRVNGEGLAVEVIIDPDLLAGDQASVEAAIMEVVNNAAMAVHAITTEAFQAATAEHLPGLSEDAPPVVDRR